MEIWRDINGYNGLYSISNLGRVRSNERFAKIKFGGLRLVRERIKPSKQSNNGYLLIQLWENNIGKTAYIHRLVASAFIDNPENKPTVNHKNGIKTDNRVENLEWATYQENLKHAVVSGLNPTRYGIDLKHSKLNNEQVCKIRSLYDSGMSIKSIHKWFNHVSITSIHNVCYRKSWIKSGPVNI